MKPVFSYLIISALLVILTGCKKSLPEADEVFYNGTVYTMDDSLSKVTAFAVKNGKIYATGNDDEILKIPAAKQTNLGGKFVYPGFHDAHCHFYGYGTDLNKIWLSGTKSFEDVLDTLLLYQNKKTGGWIFGRGWDQNDWEIKQYPTRAKLDSLFPDTPVFLLRIDGHAALVNNFAMITAGITESTKVNGGLIEIKNGWMTGILSDAAVDIVYHVIPEFSRSYEIDALLNAQQNCFAVGLTSVTDAGIENGGLQLSVIQLIDSLQKADTLKMRVNVMASLADAAYFRNHGKMRTDQLSVHSFKMYGDGALGSRGACLLQPYSDQPGHYGMLINTPSYFDSVANMVAEMDWQLNTHCIGDSSHRLMLNIYHKYIKAAKLNRWRIEHAQVISLEDLAFYEGSGIIPSVQPVHATSDMYWAEDRIGPKRIKGAYAYNALLKSAGIIVAGSDFPVEHINPLFGYYAAIARKDHREFPENGFMKENALTRIEALQAMTTWAAYAAGREKETGSIEKNKFADFVIMDEDLLETAEESLWNLKVRATYSGGEQVYSTGK